MAELHEIVIRPIITEKSSIRTAEENTYVFQVGVRANKIQIKRAVETLFGVSVEEVRTLNVRGKSKRFGSHIGKRQNWKKAYVRLSDGDQLNFFEA